MITVETQTIADLVREVPLRANTFERHQIDYCCNGKRLLQEVCAERGLDMAEIVAELDVTPESAGELDFETMSLAALCDHIVSRHHEYLRTNLPSVAMKAKKVAAVHGAASANLIELERVFQGLSAELTQHMGKEEIVLFPLIARIEEAARADAAAPQAPGGTVQNPIRMMEHEHEYVGRELQKIRELTSDYEPPAAACNTYRALYAQLEDFERDLHTHIHLENNILFPRAARLESQLGESQPRVV